MRNSMKLVLSLAIFALLSLSLSAQTTKIKKFEVKKVDFKSDLNAKGVRMTKIGDGTTTSTNWVAITIYYDLELSSKNTYLEALSIKWDGVVKSEKSKKFYTFSKKVNYAYLAPGKHAATILVSPRVIDAMYDGDANKFAKDLHVRLTVRSDKTYKLKEPYLHKGKFSSKSVARKLFDSEDSISLKNVFLDRSQTPWAVAQSDLFDMIVPAKTQ